MIIYSYYFDFVVQINLHLKEWLVFTPLLLGRAPSETVGIIQNNFASIGRWQALTVDRHSEGPKGVNTSYFFDVSLIGYLAVAVVKSSSPEDLTWNTLQGKKSCHTAVDRTAGWNIPMGLLYSKINHCEFGEWILGGHCSQDKPERGVLGREWYGTKCCWDPGSIVVKICLKWILRKYLKGMLGLGGWITMVLFGCT